MCIRIRYNGEGQTVRDYVEEQEALFMQGLPEISTAPSNITSSTVRIFLFMGYYG
jgi:hypothetical protein